MNQFRTILAMTLVIITLIPFTLTAEEGHLTILHINDTHGYVLAEEPDEEGIVGGYSKIATLIEEISNEKDNVLFLHAGDHLTGTPLSTTFEGYVNTLCLNEMELDATVIGNHEFDYSIENLDELIELAEFPILSANIVTGEEESRFEPYTEFEVGDFGQPIVVYGLTTPDTKVQTAPSNVEGLTFLDPVPVTKKLMEKWGDDYPVIIALTHLGIEGDRILASGVEGVDVIIGGHDHILLEEPEVDDNTGTLICQAGSYSRYLGELDLVFDEEGKISSYDYRIHPITEDIPEDEELANLLKPYIEEIEEYLQTVVGYSPTLLDAERENLRYGETNFGDLTADAIKWISNSDVALINSGGIRASIQEGDITYGDILSAFPFGNTIYKVDISGETLREIMEYSLSKRGDGAFLQVSGMEVMFRETDEGIEIELLRTDGEDISDDEMYSVAITSFTAEGGDGYTWFMEYGENMVDTGYLLLETIAQYLEKTQEIPEGTGRIVELE